MHDLQTIVKLNDQAAKNATRLRIAEEALNRIVSYLGVDSHLYSSVAAMNALSFANFAIHEMKKV